jgi:MFS family permease
MAIPATLRSLRHRDFRLFFGGQLISLTGSWMQIVAQSWLVYRLSGSSVLLGAVGFAGQIPIFLLSPIGGIAADRLDRRKIVIATQAGPMILASLLAALTLTGSVRIWQVFVLATLLGVVNAFDVPARQSMFVAMVGKDDLMNALALNSSIFNASRMIGPAIAGVLVAMIGEGWCFFANAVSYVAVIAGLLMMRLPPRRPGPPPGPAVAHLVEGFRFIIGNASIHAMLALLGVVSFAGTPSTVLMPVFADRVLQGGPRILGWLLGASGLGSLVGALRLASRTDLKGFGRSIPLFAVGFGVALSIFALSRSLAFSVALLVVAGFCAMTQLGASNTLIQSVVPDRLRGRVMSVYSMMVLGMAPIGSLVAGASAERFGAPVTVFAGGLCCVAAALVFWTRLPAVRSGVRKMIAEREAERETSPADGA